MLTRDQYFAEREKLVNNLDSLVDLEREVMAFLTETTLKTAPQLHADFCHSRDLMPFWLSYPPKQRGRSPKGDSQPWSEGEKSLSSNLLRAICERRSDVTFPGLPFGADMRFAIQEAFIHLDIKLTGPRDNKDEVVAPPQQISGDGLLWENGVQNSNFSVQGKKVSFIFQPKLPPFYVLEGRVIPCLTFFLKAVYGLHGLGEQPLETLEMACVPNGLLLFEGPRLATTPGLFIPGKDDKSVQENDKRTRIRLEPLASIEDGWRCRQIYPVDEDHTQWKVRARE